MKRLLTGDDEKNSQNEKNKKFSNDHNGRTRSFPHVKGNWATHVYAPIEFSKEQTVFITKLINELNTHSIIQNKIYLCEEYHISLSKCFPIKRHHIEPLWEEMKKSYQNSSE
jgi:U6 snRNA phosphodiesterase